MDWLQWSLPVLMKVVGNTPVIGTLIIAAIAVNGYVLGMLCNAI